MSNQVVIVHAQPIIRQSLAALIESRGQSRVIGEAGDGRTAIDSINKLRPDIVLIDLLLPMLNGVDVTRRVAKSCPRAKVLVLAMVGTDRQHVADAIKAGAAGALWQDASADELLRAIEVVETDQMYLSPGIADVVVSNLRNPNGNGSAGLGTLTNRQREILQLVSEGRTTKQIASDLAISPKTVDTHRQELMTKLNLFSIAELTKFAVREGLTTIDG